MPHSPVNRRMSVALTLTTLVIPILVACSGSTPPTATPAAASAISQHPTTATSTSVSLLTAPETALSTAVGEVPRVATATPAAGTLPVSTSVTPTATTWPEMWQDMPIIPSVSDAMREVYRRGQEIGRDPHSFSVVGDCQNVADYFLAAFDYPGQYDLGDYPYLQETIDYYAGSFSRERFSVIPGFNPAAVLSPLWNSNEKCDAHESPLECEFRINNPSIALISMETWGYDRPADLYADYLSQVVTYALEQGVVPILATKADNLEGDWSINAAIVQVAQENNAPLWNFWLAVQPLPGHGLTEDQFHLTYGRPFFNVPENMNTAWAVRNLTALQALDAVRRDLLGLEPPPTPESRSATGP